MYICIFIYIYVCVCAHCALMFAVVSIFFRQGIPLLRASVSLLFRIWFAQAYLSKESDLRIFIP